MIGNDRLLLERAAHSRQPIELSQYVAFGGIVAHPWRGVFRHFLFEW